MNRFRAYMLVFSLAGAPAFFLSGVLFASTQLDMHEATVLELQRAYDEGLTAEAVVRAYLERIKAFDKDGPSVNAILHLNRNAIQTARALDEERRVSGPRSPLHGVPILLKDNFDTHDMPTTGGARALEGMVPSRDAFVVARLRDAGAIILAKTNLDEFARGNTGTSSLGGQIKNPYNLTKIPGGSSGGSAVGVTALFGWLGLGTETGSSIRNPASKNNLVGFAPSHGLVSRGGIIPISITLDRAGPIARNVTDAAIAMAVIAGTDAADLFSYEGLGHTPTDYYLSALDPDGLKGARIGVLRQLFGDGESEQTAVDLINDAITKMNEAGAIIIDPLPSAKTLWQIVRDTGVDQYERGPAMEFYFALREADFPYRNQVDLVESGQILGRLRDRYKLEYERGELTGNPEYLGLVQGRAVLRDYIHELMDRWELDAIVYPFETRQAPTIADTVVDGGDAPNAFPDAAPGEGNRISTVTGLPTLVVPAGFHDNGVPVGIEFLGRLFSEPVLIRIAYAYEQLNPQRRLPAETPRIGVEKLAY